MASVLLYLAMSACATTAVGVFAGSEAWESWNDGETNECSGGSRADVRLGSLAVRGESRGGCERRACYADSDEARCGND